MSLPLHVVERLFSRLTATYGRDFMGRWEGQDAMAIKTSWGHELAGLAGHLHRLAWALENLPERSPNVIEFRNLCHRAPSPELLRLPEPAADPARVAQELSKLAPLRTALGGAQHGRLDWAKRLKSRHEAGDKLSAFQVGAYRQALAVAA